MNLTHITQRYLDAFPADLSGNLHQRQTPGIIAAAVAPAGFPGAELLHFNAELAKKIGLGSLQEQADTDFLNANISTIPIKPYATAYAGHQFGNWAGQLGDGRAIYAGEILNDAGHYTELQWKGAGATPYSRHADGRAVLRSTVREYLMSEAMYHLGVPTTRALSLSLTGENVVRDVMYSGNPAPEKGALMMRTAESFLRFGHFEYPAASGNLALLKGLADFTIENYFKHLKPGQYLEWFAEVATRTAGLIVHWYRVGFVHGVMNTDNMSILGLSIDYGPYAMLEEYNLSFTPNTTDLPGRRYAFGEQGKIAQWNLWQLANAVFPLINDAAALQQVLDNFGETFWQKHDEMLCGKFGFDSFKTSDREFFTDWQSLMQDLQLDHTLFFQKLEQFDTLSREDLVGISYLPLTEDHFMLFNRFIEAYRNRLDYNKAPGMADLALMKANNPRFILRNYQLFECIEALNQGDRSHFDRLYSALLSPYETPDPELNLRRPEKYNQVAGCSMLSCSS